MNGNYLKKGDLRLSGSIYFRIADFSYGRAEKHKANERMFKSFKRANYFQGNDPAPHHPHRYDGGHL